MRLKAQRLRRPSLPPTDQETPGVGPSGLEEVPTIALLQLLADHARNTRDVAKLVAMPDGLEWRTEFATEGRRAYHEGKMRDKLPQGHALLRALGLSAGRVLHVIPEALRDRPQFQQDLGSPQQLPQSRTRILIG